jgi:TctA family transporter
MRENEANVLTAGVFALLAMIFVPTPRYGYRFIFSQQDTSIAFFQLLANVAFAALLGAILAIIVAKMSKRTRWVGGRVK